MDTQASKTTSVKTYRFIVLHLKRGFTYPLTFQGNEITKF